MADAVLLRLPAPELDIIGWENDAAISGSIALTLPVFSFGVGDIEGTALAVPAPVLSVDGFAGVVDEGVDLNIRPSLSTAGSPGIVGSVAIRLPSLSLQAYDPNQVGLALPAPALAATALNGLVGSVSLQFPRLALAATAEIPYVATSALSLHPELHVSGTVGVGGALAATLRSLALAADGYTGVIGGVSVTLPMYDLSAEGGGALIGSAVLTFPMLVLQATGAQRTATPGAAANTFVLHTETQAMTQYDQYQFNSFARFNGVYLGAKDDGIFVLSGADDAGTAIAAYARVGVTDMSTSHLKRVDRAYVGYKADGNMLLRVTTEGSEVRDYRIQANGYGELHTNMVKLGRGLEARYWQFELRNQDGANFELDTLEILPIKLRRRVWGKP